ncbi:MAG TPA: transglycosylase SLT domain-containing protein [Burkholderiales bacterium]|jgi:soluble lytic murein transglycosylase
MIFRRFLTTITALLLSGGVGAALAHGAAAPKAASADEVLLKAYDAFRAGDAVRLQKFSGQLGGGTGAGVLAPYLEYWRLKIRIEDAPEADVGAFLEQQEGSYLADRLRADWLKELGRRGDWLGFDRTLPPLAQDDLEIRCYAWLSRLSRGDESAFDEARAVWREPRELPDGCNELVDKMLDTGKISVDDVWRRVRLLFENGVLTAARRTLAFLPPGEKHDEVQLNQAAIAPKKFLSGPPRNLDRRAAREIAVFAVLRLARSDLEGAAELLRGKLGARLPAGDVKYLWGRLAYEGARRLIPEALQWYALADDAALNDEQLAWKARAALRVPDWQAVRDAIDRMSAVARQDPAWIYWYGRALGAQGRDDGARAYYLRIMGQPNFYGLLAGEELGIMAMAPEPFYESAEADVAAAKAVPGLARALELYRLDLRSEATREWVFAIRGMDDTQLLAAAELARRAGIFDRAINTADKTVHLHNYKVRFLAPFRELFDEYARAAGLEEAWVLGLVRQESRFIVDARSSTGAKGLMQLMPATARWVAKHDGVKDFNPSRIAEVPVNIALGTGYLRHVLDDLGHPVLASTAYNAGPGRARRWRDALPLEGAVYVETIPFNETRDYVKKVMANTMYYSQLIGGKLIPLKDRLGQIPARQPAERFNEELP